MGLATSYILQGPIGSSPSWNFASPDGEFKEGAVEAFRVHREHCYREHRNKTIAYTLCTIVTTIGVVILRKNGKDAF